MKSFETAIRADVKPALGCTEPVAIAMAARFASLQAGRNLQSLSLVLSTNLFKNALEVGIPGAKGASGIHLAGALGCFATTQEPDLRVLEGLDAIWLEKAQDFVRKGKVFLTLDHQRRGLYIEAIAKGEHLGRAVIEGTHEHLVLVERDGEALYQAKTPKSISKSDGGSSRQALAEIPLKKIWEHLPRLSNSFRQFLLDGVTMNRRIAMAGLAGEGFLKIGNAYQNLIRNGWLASDLLSEAKVYTSAAVDARMSGCQLPVMTSAGSGNQGLTITLPLWALAQRRKISEERLTEALALGHAITSILKFHTGTLSAMCGCVVCSGTGLASAATYLLGGTLEELGAAINHMVGGITGIICDGAKVGCAIKLVCGVDAALQAALMAREGVRLPATNGVLGDSIEESLKNVGRIAAPGMLATDDQILEIMMGKPTEHL